MNIASKKLHAAFAALLLLVCLPVKADDWQHKKKLVIDNTAEGADLKQGAAQVPLLVRLHSGNFTFTEAKPDGSDLRFFAADGKTPLKFYVEKFDAANELGVIWVLVPQLTPGAKTDSIMVEWGNPSAPAAGDAKSVYDAAQIFDYHFGDAAGAKDATANANDAKEATAKPLAAGAIGAAAAFDGNAHIAVPASPTLKLGSQGFTFSTWVKADGDGSVYSQRDDGKTLDIALAGGAVTLSGTGNATPLKATLPVKAGEWHNIAVVAGSGKATFYVDGREAGGGAFTVPEVAGQGAIGEGFRGALDEVSLAGTARAADFIKAQASSEGADSPMLSFEEEEESGGTTSYFSILLHAVTIDGWVVIGILMLMAVISFAVMIGKAQFLVGTQRANRAFMQLYRDKSREMLMPGAPEAAAAEGDRSMLNSPLCRLYVIGVREIRHRFEAQAEARQKNSLSGPALDSIRASMDAGQVRENQRLNSQIVLLTIAISGGPFLGLLGTVVGVMITFAAIAAAGDVNVNSIAPGIAAALVATVAGLAVAIPSLFGYNWLASQIKNIAADMEVFVDEFLTRAAELHSL